MDSQSLSALLAAIVTFAIGWSVVLREHSPRPFNHFAILCFNLCLFQIASFARAIFSAQPTLADAMYLVALVALVFVPVTSLRFFRAFLQADPRRNTPPPRTLSIVAAGFLVATGYSLAFYRQQFHHSPAFLAPLATYLLGGLSVSLLEIWAAWRRTLSLVEKTRLLYLLVGGAASILLSATAFLPPSSLGVPLGGLGNVMVTIYMYFLAQTLIRYRLLDLNEVLGRMAVLAAFVLMLAVIYGLLVAWIPPDQPGVFFFNTVVASFVIVILFEPLRLRVEGAVNRWMFREKYELRRRIDELRQHVANIIDAREAVRVVIASLEESRRATHAAVYLVDQDGSGFELQGYLGPRPTERLDAAARRPFFERLASVKGGLTLSLEQLAREQAVLAPDAPEVETLDAIAHALDEVRAALCVPILAGDQLLGLLCLKDERLREAYASEEIDLFRQLAAQLAITLQNSKLYERMKERDRLAALGEMAAGLAHEIRNPLGAIKGAAQFLSPPRDDADQAGDETREFLGIIVEEVDRLNNVVSQFLDYARPWRGELQAVDLNELVRRSTQLLSPSMMVDTSVELQLVLSDDAPRVKGDAEQLHQVFLNLALNALQAMPEGGRLTVTTATRPSTRRGTGFVEVRFRDTGRGIPPAEMRNLFIPFFTTKDKGTGLGLPISQRIIENHGGVIEVRSRLGVGSTFTVVLPATAPEDLASGRPDERGPDLEVAL